MTVEQSRDDLQYETPSQGAWQTMETAPKDGTRVLLFFSVGDDRSRTIVGEWTDDKYAANPKPYWRHDLERIFGTRNARMYGPTHWMPLPAPPHSARVTDDPLTGTAST